MSTLHTEYALLDAIVDPVFLVGDGARVVYANPAAWRQIGCRPGMRLDESHAPRTEADVDWQAFARQLAAAPGDGTVRLDARGARPTGFVATIGRGRGPSGETLLVVQVRRDPSQAQPDFWKDEMISMVSHEIKNPLSAMKHSVDILLSQAPGDLTDGQKRFLDTSGRSIDRLTRLVDGFLDVSRIRSGAFTVERRPVNVREFLSRATDSFRTLFNVRRVTIDWVAEHSLETVFIDDAKLEQVLFNLLSNALKFTPEGGRVTVSARRAGVETMDDDRRLLPWEEVGRPSVLDLVVVDDGIGMSPETLDGVFTRYDDGQGGDPVHPALQRGAHLGLNISRSLIQAQGGWMDIQSELGIGTRVSVRLPLDRPTVAALSRLDAICGRIAAAQRSGRPCTVLALGKYSGDDWSDIVGSWRCDAALNPTADAVEHPALVWALNNEFAVGLIPSAESGKDLLCTMVSPAFVEYEERACVFANYAVGIGVVGRRGMPARPLGVATLRMRRARDVMAKNTLETLDSQPACLAGEPGLLAALTREQNR